MTGFKLRLALFLGLIVGPAAVLTFLSLRTVLDAERSALADVRLRVPALRAVLQRRLRAIVDQLPASPDADPASAIERPEVAFAFVLGPGGAFEYPPVLRPLLRERTPAFAAALGRAEALELGAGRPGAAVSAYRAALQAAEVPGERAEALNALGRAALAAGDTALAADAHQRLAPFAAVLDADGAHPLTLSTLRQVRAVAFDPSPTRAVGLIETWTRGVLSGAIPLHPGTRLAVDTLRSRLRYRTWRLDRPDLHAALDGISRRAGFAAACDRLLETAAVRPEATYLCGLGPAGRTLFAAIRPRDDGGGAGAVIDLDALAVAILAGPAGAPLRAAGFGLVLFDADGTAEFERRYAGAVRLVAPADPAIYRLNLGIYTRQEPFVFAHYRNRSALLVGGVGLLAATIGLGVWVLLRETAREVETARLRSDFVANVSHELRTPLTAIRLYAETLLAGRVRTEAQRREYLQTMMRESQRLGRMVGNILDFARLESGRKTYDFAATDVGQVVRTVLEEFDPVFREQGFQVDVDIPPDLPPIRADAEALETAVANLLANAVRYSRDRRHVAVEVREESGCLILGVADRGIGIPAGEAAAVFDKFRRASNAAEVATGTGLGLALVAAVARAHGGRTEALSRGGGGSVFRLTLPLTGSA